MPTVRLIIGDVRDVMSRMIADGDTFDLLVTSPPFLALRSYLPADHPDKAREIGSEPTPAAFLDTLYGLTADWGRLLPEWASICVELGDTMSGSGGAEAAGWHRAGERADQLDNPHGTTYRKSGGDYNPDGLREEQARYDGSARKNRPAKGIPGVVSPGGTTGNGNGNGQARNLPGWPLAKSMCILPHAYTLGLAYGMNPLTGQPTPAGQWRIRNVITWARPNPPVGSLGKRNPTKRTGDYKFRPACSYITVACRGTGRYFDLDAVRTEFKPAPAILQRHDAAGVPYDNGPKNRDMDVRLRAEGQSTQRMAGRINTHAGAPPLDWHRDGIEGDGLFQLEQGCPAGRTDRHQCDCNPPSSRRRTIIRRNDPRRPLLSYITVACRGTGRYFDLDAVRTEGFEPVRTVRVGMASASKGVSGGDSGNPDKERNSHNPAGAPPLDWHTDHLDGDWLWKLATAPFSGWTETVRLIRVPTDAHADGSQRTTSPDCPQHGSTDHPGSSALDDGRAAGESTRTEHNNDRPVPELDADSPPTPENSDPTVSTDSLDDPAAIPRSTSSSRTARAPSTSLPDTPSGETIDRTGHIPASPLSASPHPDTPANSTSLDDLDAPAETAFRTADTAADSCTCSWFHEVETTEKTSHYATFPLTLPRRLILAMCPSAVCLVCGWPRERVTAAHTLDTYRASNRPQTRRAVALADEHGLTDEHIAAVRAYGVSDTGKAVVESNGHGHNTDEVKALAAEAKAVLGCYFREFVMSTNSTPAFTFTDCGCGAQNRGQAHRDPSDGSAHLAAVGESAHYRPGRVLDPFAGSGTTAVAAALEGRDCTLIDLDPRNVDLIRRRLAEALHITSETHDGDVWTWTVEAPLPDQRQQVDGQLTLLAGL